MPKVLAIMVSRLPPFVSSDIISYAAHLTLITLWRLAVATLVDIVPAGFLLAHRGGELATGETDRILISIVALGAITLIPLGVKIFRGRRGRSK